jgi:hypothetical protein
MIRRAPAQVVEKEWIEFPGGELEGTRPRALCQACRDKLKAGVRQAARKAPLCFQCYRAELDRERMLKAAGDLDTASEERFQGALPFEPVNRPRLERLRSERTAARASLESGAGRFVDKRRRAQIAARHALQRIADGLKARGASERLLTSEAEGLGLFAEATHAAELQLPDAWLPFVLSR